MTTVKSRDRLTFFDRLSHLSFLDSCKLLGARGRKLMMAGAKLPVQMDEVRLSKNSLRVPFESVPGLPGGTATLSLDTGSLQRLKLECSQCEPPCEHLGGLLSLVLENKVQLGLATPPPEIEADQELSDEQLMAQALAEREQRARTERMRIQSSSARRPWTDYLVTSRVSGKSYRVALRGFEPGSSYCSCPDFRTNTLGTCKHVMKVIAHVKRKFTARQCQQPFRLKRIEIHLQYGRDVTLCLAAPPDLPRAVEQLVRPLCGAPIDDVAPLLDCLRQLEALQQDYHVYPDAEEYIQQRFFAARIRRRVDEIRRDPAHHPLRTGLLKVQLLPYQLDGIAFAVGAGRAVLADDMGLGKTIQAIGVAELLAREAGIEKVLVVCPASLKSQWRSEVHRFCDRNVQLITGRISERQQQYQNDCFYTVCNYEQVLKDLLEIEQVPWDLIILDEGQRIKNWEAKTTRVIKGLPSRFALVLSGTPLENRLEELYSVVQFVDQRRLGPGFRFFHQHRITNEKGKILGYKNLGDLRQRLQPILLRRTRESVRLELPERTTEIVRVTPTDEQKTLHDTHLRTAAQIVQKKYLTEMDLLRLRMSLLMCRLAANGSFLVNKQMPNWSSKLDRLGELLEGLSAESERKIVLFSEWTTMLDLTEPLLNQSNLPFVRLDGSVPQRKREELVHRFQHDPQCRCFITTNAGSTGLNLQSANTVINVDLPWNPAILEQRIARAHRMGQKQPVQVYLLVTEETLEERLLATLAAKKDLALAALDSESTVDLVEMTSGAEELKSRLEVLLGARPEGLLDASQLQREKETAVQQRRERVAAAGGELLGAVFHFLGELVVQDHQQPAPDEHLVRDLRSRLGDCVETDAEGRPRLALTLPNHQALDNLAQTLARLLVNQPS